MKVPVRERILNCTLCTRHNDCTSPVSYRGRPSDVMIVGEAPGRNEDRLGKPFVGPAGRFLWAELVKVGISKNDVLAANALCCYSPQKITVTEVFACRGNLFRQIDRCEPKFLLALGKTANWSVGGHTGPIGAIRGNPYRLPLPSTNPEDFPIVFPTYHPSAVLRNEALTRRFRADLKAFAEVVS